MMGTMDLETQILAGSAERRAATLNLFSILANVAGVSSSSIRTA